MLIPQLSDYIIRNLKKGYTLDSLRFSLISQGYSRISIEKAIEMANKRMANEIPKIREKPEITYNTVPETDYSLLNKIKNFFSNLFK
jgi:hypothetical protein